MKIKVDSKEVIQFMQQSGKIISTAEGNTYYYLPHWFKLVVEKGKDSIYLEEESFDKLPTDLAEAILSVREGI